MTSGVPIPRAPGKRMAPASLDAGGGGVGATRLVLAGLSGVACLAALQPACLSACHYIRLLACLSVCQCFRLPVYPSVAYRMVRKVLTANTM